jgi:AcrR family transcriptional regulator
MTEKRRTQQERREATIRKLLDAATDALIELGYSEASIQRICARTELSQGALFRHFATREALMVAVGEDVGAQLLAQYERKFKALKAGDADVVAAMRLLRDSCRSRLNQAWYELSNAARTNENLRRALEPIARNYFARITATARQLLPGVATALGDSFDVLVSTIVAVFDGEQVHRFVVHGSRTQDDARIQLLAAAFQPLVKRRPRGGRGRWAAACNDPRCSSRRRSSRAA